MTTYDLIYRFLAAYGAACLLGLLAVIAMLYWCPKYAECSRCQELFKPSRKQRTAQLLDGDEICPLCPACQRANEIFGKDREWPESISEAAAGENARQMHQSPRSDVR